MKSTSYFMQASPAQKTEMICDGFTHLHLRALTITRELRILNQWFAMLPDMAENGFIRPLPMEKFNPNHQEFTKSTDELTEQLVILAERVKKLKPEHFELVQHETK
jgi:hypothetical protein